MIGLSEEQRRTLVDKLPDTANLALGGLAFGQFLQDRPFSREVAATGLVMWLGFFAWAVFLGRKR